jgi:hypothetical protein
MNSGTENRAARDARSNRQNYPNWRDGLPRFESTFNGDATGEQQSSSGYLLRNVDVKQIRGNDAVLTPSTGFGGLGWGEGKYGGTQQAIVLTNSGNRALSCVLQNVVDAGRPSAGLVLPPRYLLNVRIWTPPQLPALRPLCDEVTTAHVYPASLLTSINRGRATMGYSRASSPLLCRA